MTARRRESRSVCGAVWVAHGLLGEVSQVDPQFGDSRSRSRLPARHSARPTAASPLDQSSVWVAFGDSTLARLNAAGKVLGETLAGSQPAGVLATPGAVWVANAGDATVQRFSSETFAEGPLRTFNVGTGPPDSHPRTERSGWRTRETRSSHVSSPNSGATLPIAVGDGPSAVASGSGAVWVANGGSRTVSRINPGNNEVVATIDVGNVPSGVVVSDGFVWVAVQAP